MDVRYSLSASCAAIAAWRDTSEKTIMAVAFQCIGEATGIDDRETDGRCRFMTFVGLFDSAGLVPGSRQCCLLLCAIEEASGEAEEA